MTGKSGARPATAVEFAIALVAARSLTEKKLRERLAARYDEAEVEAALARLRELRLVDDAAWAERFARDRLERSGKGRHRIRLELVARGIDAAAIEAALAAVLGGEVGSEVEREKASAVLQSLRRKLSRGAAHDAVPAEPSEGAAAGRSGSSRPASRAEETLESRLFRRMLARGYPACLVRELLDVS